MSEFIFNKSAGVLWLKQPLEDLSIRIKLKPREGILALPTFEDYKVKSNEENLHKLDNNIIEEHCFKWQHKVFSNWEYHKYADIYNCNSETELKYHDMIKELHEYGHKKVFTYIHEDYHLPLPVASEKRVEKTMVSLSDCFNCLNLVDNRSYGGVYSSMRHLFQSEENMPSNEERWTAMHIVLDSSDYNEDSQLLYKEEHVLVSLYHNVTYNYIIVTPNENDIQYNAYRVENQPEIEYGVEIEFGEKNNTELEDLLNTLLRKWEKQQKKILDFVMPPLGRKNFYVSFEIVSAADFDTDNLYIEFNIKIPDDIQCNGDLQGRTHVSRLLTTDDNCGWRYGNALELELACATGIDPLPLKIYLEAISVDWWGRHRTEGYSYLPLTLEPGEHKRYLSCSRPEELDTVKANNRRFFVGGCHLIKDLDVLSNPQLHVELNLYICEERGTILCRADVRGVVDEAPRSSQDLGSESGSPSDAFKRSQALFVLPSKPDLNTNFRYTESGSIAVRWRTISQSRSTGAVSFAPPSSATGPSATSLLSGAEAVLRQYKKAKATLAAATSSLPEELQGSGDG